MDDVRLLRLCFEESCPAFRKRLNDVRATNSKISASFTYSKEFKMKKEMRDETQESDPENKLAATAPHVHNKWRTDTIYETD